MMSDERERVIECVLFYPPPLDLDLGLDPNPLVSHPSLYSDAGALFTKLREAIHEAESAYEMVSMLVENKGGGGISICDLSKNEVFKVQGAWLNRANLMVNMEANAKWQYKCWIEEKKQAGKDEAFGGCVHPACAMWNNNNKCNVRRCDICGFVDTENVYKK